MALAIDGPLVLVGAGNMGGALLKGWLEQGLRSAQVWVQDPSPVPEIAAVLEQYNIEPRPQILPTDLPAPPQVMVMAVKPQIMDSVMAQVAPLAGEQTLTLSVAAGKTISSFEKALGAERAVVRSIPNTPAAIGRGITVCAANAHTSSAQKEMCSQLLAAIGEVGWVDREELIDAATAVSGSGPAYVFFLAECLAEAGRAAGLDPALSARLAQATVSGAGELMHVSEDAPSTLRENVTSPNGTTHAALEVLMGDEGLRDLMGRAVAAAAARSRALAE